MGSVTKVFMSLRLIAVVIVLILGLLTLPQHTSPAQAASPYDWLQFGFDVQHSGVNPLETTITLANVGSLQRLFSVSLGSLPGSPNTPAVADGAPAYLSGINGHDLLFITTDPGDLIALDATTGQEVWIQHHFVPNCTDSTPAPCLTTSSPAIDPGRQYVYTYGLDGFAHKHDVATGNEVSGGGWPEMTTAKTTVEKGSSALSIATSKSGTAYLYVANGGYIGDHGDYQGHLTTINLSTGTQNVFYTMCSDKSGPSVHFQLNAQPDCDGHESAIWARPGAIYDPETDQVYMATGNGDFDGNTLWGDSVLALNADGTGKEGGKPLGSYTPADQEQLNMTDADLGSAAPALLPSSAGKHYAVQGGKDAVLRILNLDNLAAGEVSTLSLPQGGRVLPQPAVWTQPDNHTTWLFVATSRGLAGLPFNAAGDQFVSADNCGSGPCPWTFTGHGCNSPIIAGNVLYCAGGGVISAFDPTSGAEKWHDNIGSMHWQSPIVAHGRLYITNSDAQLIAYGIGG